MPGLPFRPKLSNCVLFLLPPGGAANELVKLRTLCILQGNDYVAIFEPISQGRGAWLLMAFTALALELRRCGSSM